MMPEKRLPTLRALLEDIAPNVMVVGDPGRAEKASHLLDAPRQVGSYREYVTFTGAYRGKPVTVLSHGIGASGASMAFQELFEADVRTVIRAGTCGAMQANINDGDLLIATGAVREDGTSQLVLPPEYPALCDWHVIQALEHAGQQAGAVTHTGVIYTRALFYPGLLPDSYGMYMKAGVTGVEMELAVLLVLASIKGVKAGGIFVSDGNLAREEAEQKQADIFAYNPHRPEVAAGVEKMLVVSLDALASLAAG